MVHNIVSPDSMQGRVNVAATTSNAPKKAGGLQLVGLIVNTSESRERVLEHTPNWRVGASLQRFEAFLHLTYVVNIYGARS